MKSIFILFQEFMSHSKKDDEMIYCLTQSSVEPIVRFKFGAWLSKEHDELINILETQRIDLIVGDEKELNFIEFGHCVNMLKHTPSGHIHKINSDFDKLTANKVSKFIKKFPDLSIGKKINKISITLFSDIKHVKINNEYKVCFDEKKLNSGVFLKYGKIQKDHEYFDSTTKQYYIDELTNSKFTKFTETVLKKDMLSLWWHIRDTPLPPAELA